MHEQQTTSDVLMIRPSNFYANAQTAESNRFQHLALDISDANTLARREFDSLAESLRRAGVRVHVFDDTHQPSTPDALFPNNWVSFHADGSVVLYPMLASNRRLERRADIIQILAETNRFRVQRVLDISHREDEGKYLEGTGSVVLDRVNHIAYACLSPRTHLNVLEEFAEAMGYELIAFEASDRNGVPIYHTNVLLSVGTRFATVCAEAIRADQRAAVLDALITTHHRVIELSQEQMHEFAGNMLELSTTTGGQIVALSTRAAASLTQNQREQLEDQSGPLITAAIPTIETLGGGSVRCMLAEIHLPRDGPP